MVKQRKVPHCTLCSELMLVMAPSISVRIDFEPLTALKISESETELASMNVQKSPIGLQGFAPTQSPSRAKWLQKTFAAFLDLI